MNIPPAHFIGIDPDLHTTGIAIVNEQLQLAWGGILRVGKEATEKKAVVEMAKTIGGLPTLRPYHAITKERIRGIAVEAQELSQARIKGANPRDLINLAQVAGAALSMLQGMFPFALCHFPYPIQWKGNVPKVVHHKRILVAAGIPLSNIVQIGDQDDGYCRPSNVEGGCCDPGLLKTDWKHLADAVGLAQWAAVQYINEEKKRHALAQNVPLPTPMRMRCLAVSQTQNQRTIQAGGRISADEETPCRQ